MKRKYAIVGLTALMIGTVAAYASKPLVDVAYVKVRYVNNPPGTCTCVNTGFTCAGGTVTCRVTILDMAGATDARPVICPATVLKHTSSSSIGTYDDANQIVQICN